MKTKIVTRMILMMIFSLIVLSPVVHAAEIEMIPEEVDITLAEDTESEEQEAISNDSVIFDEDIFITEDNAELYFDSSMESGETEFIEESDDFDNGFIIDVEEMTEDMQLEWEEEMEEVASTISAASIDQMYGTAQTINVNSTYVNSLTSRSDENWYQFTVSDAGYFSVTLAHDYIESESTYWKAYLYDSDQSELASYSFVGSAVSATGGNIGVPSGTYYLKITPYSYSDKDYRIKINYHYSSVWENEFNDSYSTADTISLNTDYYGSLGCNDDVDWYKFTVSSEGYISLEFAHDYFESGSTYWKTYLYDADMSELTSYSFSGSSTSSTQGNIGVPSGIYYLKIVPYCYSDKDYRIKINYHSSSVWETEFNDSYSIADTISLNTDYYGSLGRNGDVDWYKFTVSSEGYISLEFAHDYFESGSTYWKTYLYDADMSELTSYSFSGSSTSSTQGNIGVPSGVYYLKIESYCYSDKDYRIKINYHSSGVWETEFNDSYAAADTIGLNTAYYGSLRNSGDADWYKFTVSSAGNISLIFVHDYINSGSTYWKAYLYNSEMSELASYSFAGSSTSYTQGNMYVETGIYYIKITGYCYSNVTYKLKINQHTHSYKNVVTKATTSKNGKIVKTCSCGATKGKTVIYYPKTISLSSTKYTYDGTVKKPSVTVKGSDGKKISSSNYTLKYSSDRKNVGKYKVTIVFKGNYSGSISKTFVINPAETSISKLTAQSKGFTVTWKKKTTQITGYQLQYSTSKNFSGVTTKTITKNTTTKAAFKGLKEKKTYYVRIRTYKTVSGTKYYSAWSTAKTVTTKK